MPFIDTTDATGTVGPRYTAAVIVPAFNASRTIANTLESIALSIRRRLSLANQPERFAISIVDDASADDTAGLIARFGLGCNDIDVVLTRHATNAGRACARNRAAAAVTTDAYLFLDHDDEYLQDHVTTCLEALAATPRADFVKTQAELSDPVHADWEPRINAGLTQNLCVRSHAHNLIGGFHEEREVEIYGCDDVLYNRLLRTFLLGVDASVFTVKFNRWPGNSFDRQYTRKFSRSADQAEVTLNEAQKDVAARVAEIAGRRMQLVAGRVARLTSLARRR